MARIDDEEAVFNAALDRTAGPPRTSYLDEVCAGDVAFRQRIELLLSAYNEGDCPAFAPATAILAVSSPHQLEPGITIGPYKLLEQIGEGGMGLVFMAEQTQPLRRRVALKVIKPGLDTRAVIARFEAERQALALMDHPNIARVFDAGSTDSGRPYFVMELVRGAPITDYCRERQLPLRQRLDLFIAVCHAVQHAHQKGVIHRDLKPTNLLVSQCDTAPVPKVIDFGVAKAIAQQLTDRTLFTGFSQLIGTPLYMSPEQADWGNQDIDTRSDVYSLGVILYELLTGATPFDADRLRSASHEEMRRILREEEPPKPSTRATTVAVALGTVSSNAVRTKAFHTAILQGDLDWIVMKALEKDRRRRYESPASLAADLRRHLEDQPIEAAGPSGIYRAQKFYRRHRARMLSLAAILLLLMVATVVTVHRTTQRRQADSGVAQAIGQQLAAVDAAISSHNVNLAKETLESARGKFSALSVPSQELSAEIATAHKRIGEYQRDQHRFAQFILVAESAQEDLYWEADDERRGARSRALDALRKFGVSDDPHWVDQLTSLQLSPAQKRQVRNTAYATLLCLADQSRWDRSELIARASLKYLEIAAATHRPTRAYYWLTAEAYDILGEQTSKAKALKAAQIASTLR